MLGRPGVFRLLSAACAAALLGCAHTSVLERIPEVAQPPAGFDLGTDPVTDPPAVAEAPGACGALGDETLRELQDQLAGQSFDLQAAWSRVEAADARARESGAYLMPRLDASLTGNELTFPSTGIVNQFLLAGAAWDSSLAASFEIDLWGRLRNREVAALLDAEASVQDLRSLAISLSSVLAEVWFGIVAERELIALLESQQRTSERFLELTQLRFGQGLGPAQDIGRQREQLLSLQGQIELARGRLESLEFQLAALFGRRRAPDAGCFGGTWVAPRGRRPARARIAGGVAGTAARSAGGPPPGRGSRPAGGSGGQGVVAFAVPERSFDRACAGGRRRPG